MPIKKPASATLNKQEEFPSLPESSVGEPVGERVGNPTGNEIPKKSSIKKSTDELTLTGRMILAQNTLGNIQSSPEWANISIQCKNKEGRDAEFKRLAKNYYSLALELAQG